MNQGRIWTVVSPSVGLPLFLGAVAVVSVVIHLALLTHTTWLPAYYNGKATPPFGSGSDARTSGVIALPAISSRSDGTGSGTLLPAPFRFEPARAHLNPGSILS